MNMILGDGTFFNRESFVIFEKSIDREELDVTGKNIHTMIKITRMDKNAKVLNINFFIVFT